MLSRSRRQHAFTLVELLIVVVILGVIASVIIGMFQNSSRDASGNALRDNLRAIRGALQLYNAQHGNYPELANFEPQMTLYSDATGATSPTRTTSHVYGPYIVALPPLPVGAMRGKTGVTTLTYANGFGWGYDPSAGTFRANCEDVDGDGDGVAFNSY